jgi:hypothetical protein|tara:strand:- start:5183 stop:5572 length:390 start_codon:yes stop_codon:yes gene_type:complete
MQKRAGILYLSTDTQRILLILENEKWSVPTFARKTSVIDDSLELQEDFSKGKIVPIELYLSQDKGFEYGTYICLVKKEFLTTKANTMSWCDLNYLPKNLHTGLRNTLNNNLIRTKIETILELHKDANTI